MRFVLVHQFSFENIGLANEFRHKFAFGIIIYISRRAHLLQLAVRHNRHAVRHGHGFFLVVRNHNAGYAHFFQRIDQFKLGLLAQFFVQRTQRFVQQQQFGAFRQRTRQSDTLLLAAR